MLCVTNSTPRWSVEVLNSDAGTTLRITLPRHSTGANGGVGAGKSE